MTSMERVMPRSEWQCGRQRRSRRPADDDSQGQVNEYREIEPAGARRHIGHVADPGAIRHGVIGHSKATREKIRRDGIGMRRLRRDDRPARRTRDELVFLHEARDALLGDGDPLGVQLEMHARRPMSSPE